jgi:hypothetical protein
MGRNQDKTSSVTSRLQRQLIHYIPYVAHIETFWARQTIKKINDHNEIIRTEHSLKGFCYHSVKRAISTGFHNNDTRVIQAKRTALFNVFPVESCGLAHPGKRCILNDSKQMTWRLSSVDISYLGN